MSLHGLTAEHLAIRNQQMRRLRARGITTHQIASQFRVSERSVRRILQRTAQAFVGELEAAGPEALLAMVADGYEEDMRELSTVAAEAEHPLVKVSALSARIRAREKWERTLERLGLVRQLVPQTAVREASVVEYRTRFESEQPAQAPEEVH